LGVMVRATGEGEHRVRLNVRVTVRVGGFLSLLKVDMYIMYSIAWWSRPESPYPINSELQPDPSSVPEPEPPTLTLNLTRT
jgi:hypothetical protein